MKKTRLLGAVWACFFALPPSFVSAANVVHNYQGKPFDNFSGSPPIGIDAVSGFISVDITTVDTETALVDISAFVNDFSFTDGFHTLSLSNGAILDDIFIRTDSSGNIEEWLIDILGTGIQLNTDFDTLDTDGSSDTSSSSSYFVSVVNTEGSKGQWTTSIAKLQGRVPWTPSGTDYQAYYDPNLDITWSRQAQIHAFFIDWDEAISWAANITYLDFSGWRLPNMDVDGDGSVVDCSTGGVIGCSDNELGYLYWEEGITSATPSPFLSVHPVPFWSGTESIIDPNLAWTLDFKDGSQAETIKNEELIGWIVADGDIFKSPQSPESFPWELFMPAIQNKNKSIEIPDIPNIVGTYVGTGTVTNTNCTDPDINRTFNASAIVEIFNQEGPKFSGRTTGEIVFEGVTFSGADELDGSVTEDGVISGTMEGMFVGTRSAGTFTGKVSGNTLSYDALSQDTAGETCTTRGSVTTIRQGSN